MGLKHSFNRNMASLVMAGASAFSSSIKADTVGYWNFNEGQGNVAHDSSRFHNDGNLSWVLWSPDTPSGEGHSAEFREKWNPTIEVTHDSSLNLDDEFTFEAQIKMSEQWYQPIIAKWSGGDPNGQHHPYLFGARPTGNGQEIRSYIKIEGENEQGIGREFWLFGNTPLESGNWYHLGASYDGEKLRVFVNGHLDGENLIEKIDIYDTPNMLTIGRSGFLGMSEPFVHGWLDDVKISNHYYNVPCPSPLLLAGLGLAGLGFASRRRAENGK
ncbi:MAG: LamG-like jellyroll fold domain-containing protein [Nanoarchaeota archaeon]